MKYLLKFFTTILLIICVVSCKQQIEKHFFDSDYDNLRWQQLQSQYKSVNSESEKILWAEEVYNFLTELNKTEYLIDFFQKTAYQIKDNSDDINLCSFIYFLLGNSFKENDKNEQALFFYNKVSPSSYSLIFDNQPIGYTIALSIIKCSNSNSVIKSGYDILLNNYQELIDVPYTQYELANIYKQQLDMDTACSIMKTILQNASKYRYSSSDINYETLREEINYYNMKKNWIYKDLDVLIKKIKYSIIRKDLTSLKKCISQSKFDCLVGQKSITKNWSFNELSITSRWNTNIVFSNELEPQSNENEAWLKTYNWGFPQLHTWYFHFKRINYPYDEKIDRGWEWQGIIFGDMF